MFRSDDNIDIIFYENEKDLIKNSFIKEEFPDLKDNLEYSEEGFSLVLKITADINNKNKKNAEETDRIIEPKTPIVTYILLGIIGIIFLYGYFINQTLLVYDLGLQKDLVRLGEVYRLITCAFVHVDIIHFLIL